MTNPMQPSEDRRSHATCGAKTRDGDPCRNAPLPGQLRCRMHGGASPQARAAAERRLAEAEAVRAVSEWGGRTDVTPPQALLELVQAKAQEVAFWDWRVGQLSDTERAGLLLTKTEQGFGPQGPVDTQTRQATPHLFLQLLHKAQDQLAAYSAAAMKAGVEAAMIEAATIQAAWLIPFIAHVVELARTLPDMDADTILRQALGADDPAVASRYGGTDKHQITNI